MLSYSKYIYLIYDISNNNNVPIGKEKYSFLDEKLIMPVFQIDKCTYLLFTSILHNILNNKYFSYVCNRSYVTKTLHAVDILHFRNSKVFCCYYNCSLKNKI